MTSSSSKDEQQGGVPQATEQVLSTMTLDGKRRWLYPVLSKGKHFWRRLLVAVGLVALFLALPVIKVGGHPAVFLDVVHREFHFFGLTLYPTDTIILMVFLLLCFVGIVMLTALLGRVWCGWGCPQTIYLEFVFRPIERLVEGREMKRKRRDEGPWTIDRVWRKALKWSIFAAISVFLSHAFLAYFVSWDALLSWAGGAPSEHFGVFVAMLSVAGLIFFDYAYFREQMCTIACPYARIQSALQDDESMIVAYDPNRGEPRGRRTRALRNKENDGVEIALGDCIDCGACVRTCPTGIDIRDGLQMECIGCTQCIDACNDIMDGIGKPHGLIRYTSERALEDKKQARIVRPRTIAYGALWVGLLVAFAFFVSGREPLTVDLGRVTGAPFTVLKDDTVANRLRFRLRNQSGSTQSFRIKSVSPEGVEIKMMGRSDITLDHGQMERVEAWIVVPKEVLGDSGNVGARFRVEGSQGLSKEADFRLLGPATQSQ